MVNEIGILAYGSLLSDPGDEIAGCQTGVIDDVETPFSIEFARSSRSRGFAPTLIPVENYGAPVRGRIILIRASIKDAQDMLYRREIHQIGSGKTYKTPSTEQKNSVRVKMLSNFRGIEAVIYTHINSNIDQVTPENLAKLAVKSVELADRDKDGIAYLIAAKANGIRTALSDAYEAEILRITGAGSLEYALQMLQERLISR